jgi:hypothetical protein
MGKLVELKTQSQHDKESVDKVMAELNELHAAGKLTGVCAVTIQDGNKWFTHISGMRLSDISYCVEWMKIDLREMMIRARDGS